MSSRPPSPVYEGLSRNGVSVIAVTVVFWVLAAALVILRFVSRVVSSALRADDWAILIGLVLSLGLVVTCIIWATIGDVGWAPAELSLMQSERWLKFSFAVIILYAACIFAIKVSILLLYKRIFEVSSKFLVAIYIVGLLVLAWFLGTVFSTVFQCSPVVGAWDLTEATSCINFRTFVLATGIATLLTDIVILCLPMPLIWGLQFTTKRKVAVSGVFLLGAIACVISILRVVSLSSTTADRAFSDPAISVIYQCLEPCVGIICACLPTIGRLIRAGRSKYSGPSSRLDAANESFPLSREAGDDGYLELGSPVSQQPASDNKSTTPDSGFDFGLGVQSTTASEATVTNQQNCSPTFLDDRDSGLWPMHTASKAGLST